MSTTKPTSFIPKPTAPRYRRGKAPVNADGTTLSSDSDSDSDDDADEDQDKAAKRAAKSLDARTQVERQAGIVAGGAGRIINVGSTGGGVSATQVRRQAKGIQVALRDVKVEDDGAVIVGGKRGDESEEEESSGEDESSEEEQDRKPIFTRPNASGSKAAPTKAGDEESSEYETDSEEESEEEKAPAKPVYRPTFVPKRARETLIPIQAELQAAAEAEARREEDAEARKKESRDLVGESIRRGMAERELTELIPDVDDTDDLDPSSEFDSWRLRELSRLARDKELSLSREEEREEIERRKAMPEEERLREDLEHVKRQEEEKRANRGERGFLEKFWHKGAFHQDDDILKRNYNVKLESSIDISSLPKIMQVKNYGKMSRSKYTHLKDQDTTQEGWDRPLKGAGGGKGEGCFNCGGPHLRRDCPNNNMSSEAGPSFQPPGQSGTGTNSSALGFGSRHWGSGGNDDQSSAPASREPRGGEDRGAPRESRNVQDDYRSPRVEDRSAHGSGNGRGEDRSRKTDRDDRRDEHRGGDRERDGRQSGRDHRDDSRVHGDRRDRDRDRDRGGDRDRGSSDKRRDGDRYRSRSPQRDSNRYDDDRRR